MERQIVELLRGSNQRGNVRLVLGVLDRGGAFEPAAFQLAERVLECRRRSRYDPTLLPYLILQARKAEVTAIHAFGWMSGLVGLAAARWLGIPFINGSIRDAPVKLGVREQVSRWCALHSDLVVANSKAGLSSYGLSQIPHARVIYNGIDLRRFQSGLSGPSREHSLCMVANFSTRKDQACVIRALKLVRQTVPGAQLTLVGRDWGTLEANRRLATELDLVECIRFVTNSTLPESDIAECSVGVVASSPIHGEGNSNAILEYMALGKPVVATEGGGNRELVQAGKNGFLVPVSIPEAMAKRLVELLLDPNLARRLGEVGHRIVAEDFSLDRMLSNYENLYARLESDSAGSN